MDQATIQTVTTAPPTPIEPPTEVRLRATVSGPDYRVLQHIAIETGTSVSALMLEAVRLLVRYYRAQGMPDDMTSR
jgi:hypothetical protein